MPGRSRGGRVHVIRALTTTAVLVASVVAGCGGTAVAPTGTPGPVPSSPNAVITSSAPSQAAASVGPSPGAAIALPAEWTTYISKRFAYTIEHPTGWVETPAANDWPVVGWPPPDGDSSDRFEVPGGAAGQLTVSSDVLAEGEVASGRRAEIDQETAMMCKIGAFTKVVVDGAEGRQNDQFCFGHDYLIEVFVGHADRIYLMYWLSPTDIPDIDRAIFDEMMKQFRFAD